MPKAVAAFGMTMTAFLRGWNAGPTQALIVKQYKLLRGRAGIRTFLGGTGTGTFKTHDLL